MKLAVAGDPELAAAITRLQGEWNSQTGAEVQVLQIAEKDLAESEKHSGRRSDYAIRDLSAYFAEQKMIVPVPHVHAKNLAMGGYFRFVASTGGCLGR